MIGSKGRVRFLEQYLGSDQYRKERRKTTFDKILRDTKGLVLNIVEMK